MNVEVPAPAAGTLAEIVAEEGITLPVGAVLGMIGDGAVAVPAAHPTPLEATLPLPGEQEPAIAEAEPAGGGHVAALDRSGPAVRKLVAESGLDAACDHADRARAVGITKADVIDALARPERRPLARHRPASSHRSVGAIAGAGGEREVRVRMTRLRRRIAERLKAAQNAAAMLTTFNEIDMSQTIALRERWREAFEKKHGVRLGFMSIFVKAAIAALKEIPGRQCRDRRRRHRLQEPLRHRGRGRHRAWARRAGLRDADRHELCRDREGRSPPSAARRATANCRSTTFRRHVYDLEWRDLWLAVVDADPEPAAIRHPRHAQDRAPPGRGDRARRRKIEIRPMMYVALSYDHRLVDGREAVGFLVRIKELVEDPSRLLFDI